MKALVAAAALSLLGASAQAEALPVRLKDGASWTQSIVRTRTDETPKGTQSLTVKTVLKATYHSKPGQPATLQQDFVSMESDGLPAELLATLVAQARVTFPAVVEVDEALTPTRVVNWAELRENALGGLGGSDPRQKAAANAARSIFEKFDDRRAASLFKELNLISLGQGTAISVGERRPYEGEVPSALGGPPIQTRGAFSLESFDPAAGRAMITWTQELDPASTAANIRAVSEVLIAKVAPDQAEKAKAQFAGLSISRKDRCQYQVDAVTGLAVKADCTVEMQSTTGANVQKRTERWLITQSAPEPA